MTDLPKRKPNRLRNYDYSQNGMYFITICAKGHKSVFGKVVVGDGLARPVYHIELSAFGMIARDKLLELPDHYTSVTTDQFVVMPNHIHVIVVIDMPSISGGASPAPTLGNIIGGYKSAVSRLCGFPIWQRSYHDHVIRDEGDYLRIAGYIEGNPALWADDEYYV